MASVVQLAPEEVRARLETDRSWSVYALGDLAPEYREHARWYGVEGAPSLALLYAAFHPPVLFALGEAEHLAAILDAIPDTEFSLSVRPEHLPVLRERCAVRDEAAMWRMVLRPEQFSPLAPALSEGCRLERLSPTHLPLLHELFADGIPTREAPDFFAPSMLEAGIYFGIIHGEALLAAAGTHLLAPSEGVGTVGNVYTRRSARGLGLARKVTGAVTGELLRMGLRTIALNVNQRNPAALRVYENLGYERYCPFYEGVATRR